MRFRIPILFAFLVALFTLPGGIAAQRSDPSCQALLRAATDKDVVDGDFPAAVKQYQATFDRCKTTDRAVAAQALLRMADVYQQLSDARAKAVYEQIARDYPDQKDVLNAALARLGGATQIAANAQRQVLASYFDLNSASVARDGHSLTLVDSAVDGPVVRDLTSGQDRRPVSQSTGGKIYAPVLSPDNKQVAYAWKKDAGWELRVIANEPQATPRPVVTSSSDGELIFPRAWLPDGESLIVELQRPDETWQFARVSVANGTVNVLKSLEWRRDRGRGEWKTSLSPDGKWFAYAAYATNPKRPVATGLERQEKRIYLLATDATSETELTKTAGISENPVWAPDGSHVLFISNLGGSFDLWAVPTKAGKATGTAFLVHRGIGRISPSGMSASGTYYYAPATTVTGGVQQISLADVSLAKTQGARPMIQPAVGITPTWSPDGKLLAFARNNPAGGIQTDLVFYSLQTGEEKRYARLGGPGGVLKRIWLHDGSAVLFQAAHNLETPTSARFSLDRIDVQSGKVQEVLPSLTDLTPLTAVLSPDDKILYAAAKGRVVAVDLASGSQHDVFSQPDMRVAGLALSPALDRFAIYSFKGDRYSLGVLKIDGTDNHEVLDLAGLRVGSVSWTSDSKALLFAQNQTGNTWQLMRVSAQGGPAEFTGVEYRGVPTFDVEPGGSRVAFSGEATTSLWAIDNLLSALKVSR